MSKLRLPIFISILFNMLVLLATSCSQKNNTSQNFNPSEIDKSWATGVPCEAPCWYGLTPGLSTLQELSEKVGQMSFINESGIRTDQYERWNGVTMEQIHTIHVPCINPVNQTCAFLYAKENQIIDEIILLPNYEITFIDFVSEFGNPDFIAYNRSTVEAKGCSVSLIWKTRMTGISFEEERYLLPFGNDLCDKVRNAGNKVPPELPVQTIVYRHMNSMDTLLNDPDLIKWQGFREGK
jgi:hypothetical protein